MGMDEILRFIVNDWLDKLFDFLILAFCIYKCFKPGLNGKRTTFIVSAVFVVLITLTSKCIDHYLDISFLLFCLEYIIVTFLFSVAFFKGKIYIKLFLSIACSLSIILIRFFSNTGIMYILNLLFSETVLAGYTPVFTSLLSMLFMYLFALLITRSFVGLKFPLPAYYWAVMTFILMMDFITILPIRNAGNEVTISRGLAVLMMVNAFAVTLMLCYLFARVSREYSDKVDYQLISQNISIQKSNLQETRQLYDKMRVLRHEINNYTLYMNHLLENKEYDKLKEYFDSLDINSVLIEDSSIAESGNSLVNAVLSQKLAYANSNGIRDVSVNAALPENPSVKDSDLCSIISNMFDNAIEASLNMENPKISCDIGLVKNYISIVVRNRIPESVLRKNPQLDTTKSNTVNHGIGIRVVRRLAEKYDGMVTYTEEDGQFIASVMLKNTECK